LFSLSGCGKGSGGSTGGNTGGSNPISVSVTSSSTTVDGSDAVTLTATLTNDSSNAGVTWATPSLGSLSSTTATSPTYTAPTATSSAQSVTLTATSVSDKSKSNSVTLTIPAAPTITTSSLPSFNAGMAYLTTLAGSGGIPPYTWKLAGGTLPTGVSLDATTGKLSAAAGATTTTAATSLTFQMIDSGSPTALTATAPLSLTIIPPISVSASASSANVDGSDSVTLTATVANDSSNAGVTWTAPAVGSLSSTTAASPTYTAPTATSSAQSVTLTATSVSDSTKSKSVTLTIPAAPTILTGSLPLFVPGAATSTTLVGSGGIAPYTWKLTGGTLPTGVSLNTTTGVISAAAGSTTVTPATSLTFQLTDSGTPTALTATAKLSLTINAPSISGNVSFDGIATSSSSSASVPAVSTKRRVLFHSATTSSSTAISLPVVSVSINTPSPQTTTTDSNGDFSFASVPNGTYTITPSLTNTFFTPATQSITVNNNAAQASFKAHVGYSISGTVSYSGTAKGPIYLVASGAGPQQGTSIAAPGPFTINGVEPGNYTIYAFRDALGFGAGNASDPTGSATADIGASGNLTGVSIALADPAPVTFDRSSNPDLTVTPFDQGVVLNAIPILNNSNQYPVLNEMSADSEVATSYTVQWCADSSCASPLGSKSFPATGGRGNQWNPWFLSGLTDGQILYFRYQGVAGSASSEWSSPATGPITVGQPAGSVTVSGNVTLPYAATGPLYICFENMSTSTYYYTRIPKPVSPQNYSIQLPAGTYEYTAFVDQGNQNVEVNGDMQTTPDIPVLTVTDTPATQDITLVNGGYSYVIWGTDNVQTVGSSSSSTQQYSIYFRAIDGTKHLVGAKLLSGPNAITVQDIPRNFSELGNSFYSNINLYNTPRVGDSYSLQLTYSDGTTETKTENVTGVVGNFGANPSPAGVGTELTPNFTWTNPAITDSIGYSYFGLYSYNLPVGNAGFYWGGYLPSNVDSIAWGTNPLAGDSTPPTSMVNGGVYTWFIATEDSKNNASSVTVYYEPGYTGVWLPATNPSTLGVATVGKSYLGTITASGGTAPYTFTVYGPGDGLSASSSGGTVTISGTPLVAGTITFQVYVFDNTNKYWGPVTYTINVGN
jgi:hypothetical protein